MKRLIAFLAVAGTSLGLAQPVSAATTCHVRMESPGTVTNGEFIKWVYEDSVTCAGATIVLTKPDGTTESLGTFTVPRNFVWWDTTDHARYPDSRNYDIRADRIAAPGYSVAPAPTDHVGAIVDSTPPVGSYAGSVPGANINGWLRTSVTVYFSCTDATSGVVASTLSAVISAEGTDRYTWVRCMDVAGLGADVFSPFFNIDKTPPGISVASRTAANSNGWNNADVTVVWNCTDSLSGPVSASITKTVSGETTAGSVSATCLDLADNSASTSVGDIRIDRTLPTITYVSRTTPNAAGWNNTDVTAMWRCEDSLSGAQQTSVSQALSAEGIGQSMAGVCTDLAGNSSNSSVGGINIDKTGPATTIASHIVRVGQPIVGAADDALSGVASIDVLFENLVGFNAPETRTATCTGCGTSHATWSMDTTGLLGLYRVTAKARDVADNEGSAVSSGLVLIVG